MLPERSDIIVAVATPAGRAGIAVVRLSGDGVVAVAAGLLPAGALEGEAINRQLRLLTVRSPATGEVIDHAMVCLMRGPRSYTGEDVVELQVHGGPATVAAVVAAARAAGARLAEPGEFTLRAFLNGRIDLGEAEAVAALIESRSEAARRVALRQLDGGLRQALGPLRAQGIAALADLEARLDFPDDELGPLGLEQVGLVLGSLIEELSALIDQYPAARRAREGQRVVLLGRPNVGKSSLLNALLGHPRAIVDEAPGTTRDYLEDELTLGGLAVTVVDTAGQHESASAAEDQGVRRARQQAAAADLVLLVINVAEGITADDQKLMAELRGQAWAAVLNQSDRVERARVDELRTQLAEVLAVTSATAGDGIDALRRRLTARLAPEDQALPLVTEQRHVDGLTHCLDSLEAAADQLKRGQPEELIATDLRCGLDELGRLVGEGVTEALLETIFSRFCIGK